MAVGDRDRPNSSPSLPCALDPRSPYTGPRSLGWWYGLIGSGEGCKWLGLDWLVSVGSEERDRGVLDDWVRLVGEHRGISTVSSTGDRVTAGAGTQVMIKRQRWSSQQRRG